MTAPIPRCLHDAICEAYSDTRIIVEATVRRFCFKYGGDVEESLSEADIVFVSAFLSHDQTKGSFQTWLTFLVWKRCMELLRRGEMRNARLPRSFIELETMPTSRREYWLTDLLDELSADGQFIVHLVLDPPVDVQLSIYQQAKSMLLGEKVKAALREFLTDIGWRPNRISRGFVEVGKAINGQEIDKTDRDLANRRARKHNGADIRPYLLKGKTSLVIDKMIHAHIKRRAKVAT